ncbi:MAG: hypothetical protein Kow002_02100 [Anaerolineales bacterium]
MDSLQEFLHFAKSGWGISSLFTVSLPWADQLTTIVLVPATSPDESYQIATINSIICVFVLLLCFAIQQRRKSIGFALFLFVVWIAAYLGYDYFVSPIQDLKHIGINADVTYLIGYPIEFFQGWYLVVFGSLTGAFTSLMAYIYRPSSFSYRISGW